MPNHPQAYIRQHPLFALAVALSGMFGITDVKAEEAVPEGVEINDVNFPDDGFRKYVSDKADADGNGVLSAEEINAVTSIDCKGMQNIYSLEGISYFENIENLDCSFCNLTELDVSELTKLTTLNCKGNDLSSLTMNELPYLTTLDCSGNNLSEIYLGGLKICSSTVFIRLL